MTTNHPSCTGDFVSFDGYVYKIMAIRNLKDGFILKSRLNSDLGFEEYFILKRHSHLDGQWAKTCLCFARAIHCEKLTIQEVNHVNILNNDYKKLYSFERFDDPYFSFFHQSRYLFENSSKRDECVDRINKAKKIMPRYFSTLDLKLAIEENIGIDIFRPLDYTIPNSPLQMRLIMYRNYMHINKHGHLLLTDVDASSIDG